MKIIVDADACPVKEIIIKIAKSFDIPVLMVADTSHIIGDDYSETVIIPQGNDAADIALINAAEKGDIIITQDYGVASMALGKQAYAIHHNGFMYNADNMDKMMFERFLSQKVRRAGGRTRGPKKRTKEDDNKFAQVLQTLCKELQNS